MKDTIIEMYLGETRAVELEITTNSFETVPISGASYEVYSTSKKIIEETPAVVTAQNKIGAVISKENIAKPGEYFIIWKVNAFLQDFILRTKLFIKDVL